MKYIIIFILLLNTVFAQSFNGVDALDQATVGGIAITDIGSINGSTFIYSTEYINSQYISFGGTDEYLSFSELNCGQTLSVNCWFNIPASPPTEFIIIGNTGLTLYSTITQVASSNRFYFSTGALGFEAYTETTGWHMFTGTINGTDLDIYIDGTQIGTGKTLAVANDFKFRYIGAKNTTMVFTTGYLDELVVYNKVITTGVGSECASLYADGIPGNEDDYNPEDISGCVHLWNMEQSINALIDVVTDVEAVDNGTPEIIAY